MQWPRRRSDACRRGSGGYVKTGRNFLFSAERFGGSVHSSFRPLSNSARKNDDFMPPSMMSQGSTASPRPVAEDVEIGIDAGFGDRGAPVAAVALGRFDRRRHAAIAQRQQRLVVRMPLRLDVEVDVVEIGDQGAQPLALAVRDRGIFHRQPLVRGARAWGSAGSRWRRSGRRAPSGGRGAIMTSRNCAVRSRMLVQVVVCLRRQPDHVVELQVVHAVRGRSDRSCRGSRRWSRSC